MEQTNEELEVVKVDDDEINCEEKIREINGVASESETKTATDITTTKVRFFSFVINSGPAKVCVSGGRGGGRGGICPPFFLKNKGLVILFLTTVKDILVQGVPPIC
jgi:hypothetical protein